MDHDEELAPIEGDNVTPAAFKNYKPSPFEQRGLEKSDTTNWRKRLQMSKVKFDDKAKERYLQHYALTGRANHAAAAAGVCPYTVNKHRKNDPEFDQAVEVAKGMWADDVHAHAMKLVAGVKEPIIGGPNKDEIVGYKMVYATNILAMEMKRTNPEYKERSEVDIKGGAGGVLVVPAAMTPAQALEEMAQYNAEHSKEPGADD